MYNLDGKKAVVTGASGAIGGAIAKSLHSQGAEIVISGTNLESLEKLKAELGDRCYIISCNLADADAIENLISKSEEQLGQIDILVNNAGLTKDGLMMRMKDEDWSNVISVNLEATFRLTRAAIRGMASRRYGRIINISSVVGVTGNPGQTNYAASKAGIIGMSKSLAAEMASRGITVNCVAPGFIETPMTNVLNENQKSIILNKIPAGRMGSVSDIANATLFLASDEAAYITGQTLHVNGGMAMI